eukprot:364283-Chlamydomonas_euryale.AAC.18
MNRHKGRFVASAMKSMIGMQQNKSKMLESGRGELQLDAISLEKGINIDSLNPALKAAKVRPKGNPCGMAMPKLQPCIHPSGHSCCCTGFCTDVNPMQATKLRCPTAGIPTQRWQRGHSHPVMADDIKLIRRGHSCRHILGGMLGAGDIEVRRRNVTGWTRQCLAGVLTEVGQRLNWLERERERNREQEERGVRAGM